MTSRLRRLLKVAKAVGEPTRLRILRLLATRPMYVCEMESVLNMSQPRVSQHLRVLREAELVCEEKNGQRTLYSLEAGYLERVLEDLRDFLSQDLSEVEGFEEERRRMALLETDSRVRECMGTCVADGQDETRR